MVTIAYKNEAGDHVIIGSFRELKSWANNLFQDKKFATRALFNKAYDDWVGGKEPRSSIERGEDPVIINSEDVDKFEQACLDEEYEGDYTSLIQQLRRVDGVIYVF